jgi:hypothetical protein
VAVDVLLDPAAHVVDDTGGELDDVERVQDERASSSWSSIAFLYPWNGSRVAISTRPGRRRPRSVSQVL